MFRKTKKKKKTALWHVETIRVCILEKVENITTGKTQCMYVIVCTYQSMSDHGSHRNKALALAKFWPPVGQSIAFSKRCEGARMAA
jgi:hypothetical protein